MKFVATTLLVVTSLAGLGVLGVRNIVRAVALERQVAFLTEAKQRLDDFARQQIRLCEFALASKPDTRVMATAEEKFREIQQRYGQLQIEDPHAVAIVTIPEIVVQEHRTYAWRIYVPPDHHVELAAYVDDGRSPPSEVFTPDSFAQSLPAGESVIRCVWKERDVRKWGQFASYDDPRWNGVMAVSINEDDFRWQSDCRELDTQVYDVQYPAQQTLFVSDDASELLRVVAVDGSQDLNLVVRQSKPIATE